MRERFARFMVGRNGYDQLNAFLAVLGLVLPLLGVILSGKAGTVLFIAVTVLLVYMYFRMFSRNLARRREENGKYIRMKYKVSAKLRGYKERWVQRKDYKFFTCPSCHTTLRVPRGRGKIKIVCRKCGVSFMGKS